MNAKQNFFDLHIQFFKIFTSQDPKNAYLDIVFEIGGKKLYANKTKLCIISPTFESMLSDRWTSSKNEPIQIKDYSFNDFKEFLTFIYSGECSLTEKNIFTMIDMAEFYQVKVLKNVCDQFLSEMEITAENALTIMEISNKYSLVEVKKTLSNFVRLNFWVLMKHEKIINASKETVEELVAFVHEDINPEDLFQGVYEWVENHVKQNKDLTGINENDAIKAKITPFLSYIQFKKMNLAFLVQYVVKRGNLFSCDELSDYLNTAMLKAPKNVKIIIKNSNGQTISGYLPSDSDVVKVIKTLKNRPSVNNHFYFVYWDTKCNFPTTPSPLKKKDGVEWYLSYYSDGDIGVKHSSDISENSYLLAELTAGPSGFEITSKCKIEIE